MMPTFRRVKIQATVETSAMLLPEEEIASTVDALKERLKRLDLSIVSLESTEPPAAASQESADDDPWSIRGQPVE